MKKAEKILTIILSVFSEACWQAWEIREWISQQGRDDILHDAVEKWQYNQHRHRGQIMSVVGTCCRDDDTLVLRSCHTIAYHCNMYLAMLTSYNSWLHKLSKIDLCRSRPLNVNGECSIVHGSQNRYLNHTFPMCFLCRAPRTMSWWPWCLC